MHTIISSLFREKRTMCKPSLRKNAANCAKVLEFFIDNWKALIFTFEKDFKFILDRLY